MFELSLTVNQLLLLQSAGLPELVGGWTTSHRPVSLFDVVFVGVGRKGVVSMNSIGT